MMIWLILAAIFLIAVIFTGWLRRYALARSLMDVPNNRSSHTVSTPRGGGMAIVAAFGLGLIYLTLVGAVAIPFAVALGGAGALIALVGFLDDHGHIAARWRLVAHFISAGWMLAWLGGAPSVAFGDSFIPLGWAGAILFAFGLVWLLNLYNFMDGIDGIASVEAICVCLGGVLLYLLRDGEVGSGLPALALLAAVAGFLVWNFPPARIFMGDGGSGFLGITLGGLMLAAAQDEPRWLWSWLTLLGVFVVDATWTLVRRLLRRERLYEAHRAHGYQHASRRHGAHRPVTLGVLGINLGWLLPWSVLIGVGYVEGWIGLLVAYLPLCALAYHYRAGTH